MVDGALVDTYTRAYKIVIAGDDIGETLGGGEKESLILNWGSS